MFLWNNEEITVRGVHLSGLRIRIRIVFESWIGIRIRVKSWIRIRINVKFHKLFEAQIEPWMLTMKAWMLKMEPSRVCRPAVADSNHFDEEQDPDSHCSEKLDLDPN